jgi:FHS family L-fucose permease-like MFS transporter
MPDATASQPATSPSPPPAAAQTAAPAPPKAPLIAPGYAIPFAIITLLFFLWAFPNTFNDVLIKQFIKSLELTEAQTGFLPLALKTGYFFVAIPAGLFMQRWGYKNGILVGLALFATGCFLFYPAALSREFLVFLGGIFVMAGGCAFLEIGANSFVVNLGDKSTSERRLNFAQSFNPIGGITAAALGTVFIFSGNEPADTTIQAWKKINAHDAWQSGEKLILGTPNADQLESWKSMNAFDAFVETENLRIFPTYLTLGVLVLFIALVVWRARFPDIAAPAKPGANASKGAFANLLKYPHWWGAIISQFFYLGAQLGTWSYLINYVKDNTTLGEKQAGAFLVANMVLFMIGRFLSTYLMKFVRPQRLMGIYACTNVALVTIAILGSKWASLKLGLGLYDIKFSLPFAGATLPFFDSYAIIAEPIPVGIYALIATTLFMSLMYPTNFASGMKGLGPNAKLGASILVMSLIGGALLSLVMGRIWGLELSQIAPAVAGVSPAVKAVAPALIVPILAYCVIAWYAFIGSRPRGPIYD